VEKCAQNLRKVDMEDKLQEIRKKGLNQGLIAIQAQKKIILKAIEEGATLKTSKKSRLICRVRGYFK